MDNSITQSRQQPILVTGAARSGKSEWAETLARQTTKAVTYIATATVDPDDREWQARIDRHQQRRPHTWQTKMAVVDLAQTIESALADDFLLVDSLGTWVANLLDRSNAEWENLTRELLAVSADSLATIVMVAEETGWGVVPAYPSGRLFRDRLGMLTRQFGAISNPVYLVTGGHVLNLSQLGHKLVVTSSED
ncbi:MULTISPECIES: bifunctional adenosylcobinamide kinase/adenosylcobinamide-phosphate guanylyltransferase [unclassified Chamaesiphon]|uniref:bifunctional adenosylcobinamide kinase/adenosylcobinamide-phosphate guanylyltransferase n=1 Tax=unclassified Chamaesiphon TaxID=2620921 RepID=UPI00286CB357|nr:MULTISPECIES: bifunctional adenosylcobinamide kinase/adenosylcobinamide-phosphate guanylyltransferase [unclassified Chamaesiphon]